MYPQNATLKQVAFGGCKAGYGLLKSSNQNLLVFLSQLLFTMVYLLAL